MLRYNSIWLYGSCVGIWILLQMLFNERCLPRKFYYLFIGAGLHAVSVAHIPEDIKLIDTHINCKNNILWSTRLTPRQRNVNLFFQNFIWFIFNFSVIVGLLAISHFRPQTEVPTFWPFILKTSPFDENKIFRVLWIISSVILFLGFLSLVLAWRLLLSNDEETEDCDQTRVTEFDGWVHDTKSCPGCQGKNDWHCHVSDKDLHEGIEGTLGHIIAPLFNVWQNFVDKNTA